MTGDVAYNDVHIPLGESTADSRKRAIPSLDNGIVVKWYGTITDIEARKTAEQAIAIQNTRLQLLLKLTKQITSDYRIVPVVTAILTGYSHT